MVTTALICKECGHQSFQWVGRCPSCGAWETLSEVRTEMRGNKPPPAPPIALNDVAVDTRARLATGIGEFDRVIGGGFVSGSTVLIAGEPGVGKSTLMLQAAAGLAESGKRVLLVCGEESIEQVAARASRLGAVAHIVASDSTDVEDICSLLVDVDVAMIDSVQTLRDPSSTSEPGSVTQVRTSAASLSRAGRAHNTAIALVGHVTKDGAVAGPRTLEHLVDAVITFEGDRSHSLRTIRTLKNRYGPTSEVGVFEMHTNGLAEVTDPSRLFLGKEQPRAPGAAVGCLIEGRRPLAIEVQTLVVKTQVSPPKRVALGIENSRLGVAIAILEARGGVALGAFDVYASVAGGFRVSDPAIDLALILALASSRLDCALPADTAAIGEVGLGGEIRNIPAVTARVKELTRLGFTRAITPENASTLVEALHSAGLR
ncbi:MAG: DNA repair protein RadA [Actinomycetota bacterium]